MMHSLTYFSPLGELRLFADEIGLTRIAFEGEGDTPAPCDEVLPHADEVLRQTTRWLDLYFRGGVPSFLPPLHLCGSAFRREVWEILLHIPYGQTVTYGEIARRIAARRGMARMSAQAVGGAVGHNQVPIIVPCHRVIGAGGALVGYTGGMEKKICLLRREGILPPD